MRFWTLALVCGASLAALAACNKPAPAGDASTAPAAASAPAASPAASAGAPGPLTATDMHRKPGLWKQTMAMDGSSGGPGMQYCVDDASEARLSLFAQKMGGQGKCSAPNFTRNLDGSISFTGTCDMGAQGHATTSGVIKGDFSNGYTMTSDTQYSGSPVASLNGDHKMVITATWTGPCAPGQRGGDMIMANGMKVNMLDRQAAQSGAPQ